MGVGGIIANISARTLHKLDRQGQKDFLSFPLGFINLCRVFIFPQINFPRHDFSRLGRNKCFYKCFLLNGKRMTDTKLNADIL